MIDTILENRKYVKEYDITVDIPESLIDSLLQRTWRVTPSKNQFMPYTVHVLGPSHQNYKNIIYQKVYKRDIDRSPGYLNRPLPLFNNITNCSYLLVFCSRVETVLNAQQTKSINKGLYYEQLQELDGLSEIKTNDFNAVAYMEVGMFANTFGTLCIEHNLDVSHTLCGMGRRLVDHELPFITRPTILLMTVGKAKTHCQPWRYNLRPDYHRIVNFVD